MAMVTALQVYATKDDDPRLDERGRTARGIGDIDLNNQSDSSFVQRLEDWLFTMLPIEQQL